MPVENRYSNRTAKKLTLGNMRRAMRLMKKRAGEPLVLKPDCVRLVFEDGKCIGWQIGATHAI